MKTIDDVIRDAVRSDEISMAEAIALRAAMAWCAKLSGEEARRFREENGLMVCNVTRTWTGE